MKAYTKHVNDESFQILVLGDEQSDELRRTARHVETCSEYQHRLLTSRPQLWESVPWFYVGQL